MGHPLCWSLFLFSISFSPYNKVGAIFISQAKKKKQALVRLSGLPKAIHSVIIKTRAYAWLILTLLLPHPPLKWEYIDEESIGLAFPRANSLVGEEWVVYQSENSESRRRNEDQGTVGARCRPLLSWNSFFPLVTSPSFPLSAWCLLVLFCGPRIFFSAFFLATITNINNAQIFILCLITELLYSFVY